MPGLSWERPSRPERGPEKDGEGDLEGSDNRTTGMVTIKNRQGVDMYVFGSGRQLELKV